MYRSHNQQPNIREVFTILTDSCDAVDRLKVLFLCLANVLRLLVANPFLPLYSLYKVHLFVAVGLRQFSHQSILQKQKHVLYSIHARYNSDYRRFIFMTFYYTYKLLILIVGLLLKKNKFIISLFLFVG